MLYVPYCCELYMSLTYHFSFCYFASILLIPRTKLLLMRPLPVSLHFDFNYNDFVIEATVNSILLQKAAARRVFYYFLESPEPPKPTSGSNSESLSIEETK